MRCPAHRADRPPITRATPASFATPLTNIFSIFASSNTRVPGTWIQAGENLQLHIILFRHFHRAVVEHLRAKRRQLQHFAVGDLLQLARAGHLARVGGVNALDVGVDLAQIGVHAGGDRHRARVGAAAAEGGDILIAVQPLEPGDDNDAVLAKLCADALRRHPLDAGGAVGGIGDKSRLPAEQRDGGAAFGSRSPWRAGRSRSARPPPSACPFPA